MTDQGTQPQAGGPPGPHAGSNGETAGATGEMIFSGDELLRGDTLNTNQCYLGERLLDLGIFATHALTVADDLSAMVQAIKASLARRPVVLVLSGGLGPTEDDLTREAVADALGRPLEHREDLFEAIKARFAARGYIMGDSNRKQALIPRGATAIPLTGTAPGFHVWEGSTLVVALPGVPWELKQMWEETVEPVLRRQPQAGDPPRLVVPQVVRRIRTFGVGESMLAEKLGEFDWHGSEVSIGTRAHLDGVTVILRGRESTAGLRMLETTQSRILEILGDRVYSVDGEGLAEIAGRLLAAQGLTVSTAESCTGGLVAKRFTDVPGSSAYFMGGVVAYDNQVKIDALDVPAGLLAQYGAVSEETAAAMAEGICRRFRTDCALSTTGIAGPDGGSTDKPVGLAYIGCVVDGVTVIERNVSPGHRDQVRERTAYAALDLLRRRLTNRS